MRGLARGPNNTIHPTCDSGADSLWTIARRWRSVRSRTAGCWTLHILPKGFTKSRCYGGWSNTRRQAYQQQCERLQPLPPSTAVDLPEPSPPVLESPLDEMLKCPHCKTAMVLESDTRRPSWRELFYGPDHPRWMEWRGSG